MPLIKPYGGKSPRIADGVFLAENATVIGDIDLAADVSIWYGVVLRADVGFIRIGARSNVQDLTCIHMTTGISDVVIGEEVTIGHHCTIHGARIGDGALIGMGSVILDNADIGAESLIAAGSVVTPRTIVPPRSLVRGAPAKVVRTLHEAECTQGRLGALHYLELARGHRG